MAAAAKLAEASTPSNNLRTPLLMRNALSAGLARVLSGPVFSTPAPAVTVMEVGITELSLQSVPCSTHVSP